MHRELNETIISVLLVVGTAVAQPKEEVRVELEAEILGNVRQLTNPSMGLEKAGEAYFSHDGKMVIFQAVPQGKKHYQIYTMPTRGETPTMVSTGRGACTCAYFHPDGDKIIFASTHEDPRIGDQAAQFPVPGYKREGSGYAWDFNPFMDIYEAKLDGSGLVHLTQSEGYDAEGAYSRDGKTIVFASNRDGHMNLYKMNADGTGVRQLTRKKECYNGGPFLSPDQSRIVFRADRQRRDYLQIFMINADGTNEIQLTSNDAVNWAPYWHPNSKSILFTTSLHGHSNYEVYLMNVDTKKFQRVTHHPRFDGLPVFSDDGKKMMWTSKRGPDDTSQLFIADFTMPEGFE